MTIGGTVLWWSLIVVGLGGTALCAGTETGIYTLNRVRLSIRVAAGGARGRTANLLKGELDQPDRAIATLLIANTLCGSLVATGIGELLTAAGWSESAAIALNVVILTPALVILGEIVPKELFRAEADRLTYRVASFLVVARLLLTWIGVIPLVGVMVHGASRALGLGEDVHLGTARERIAALLKEGARHGVLSEAQTTLLDRALALRNTAVADEMQPWAKVRAIAEGADRARLLQLLAQHPFSRFPVADGAGRVIGTVEHLDICLNPGKAIADLMRPPVFLPPEMPVREALLALGRAGAKMAVVQQTSPATGGGVGGVRPLGIVTAKDLIEPLTGELAAW